MSITYGFFNAEYNNGAYDRKYTADQFAEVFASIIGNGLSLTYENCFKVVPYSGLTIQILPGLAWIEGYWAKNSARFSLSVAAAPSQGYRQDLVVLRFNRSDRSIIPMIITGSVSETPQSNTPSYTRTPSQYDLVLAAINFTAGDSEITESMIDDLRGDPKYCGLITTIADLT